MTSGPAQPGVPVASYAPDGTVFYNILHSYTPAEMAAAYGVDGLHSEGWTGAGQTIVIVDSYGSPTALADLQMFSTTFGLPAPDLTIVYPEVTPTYSKAMKDIETGWAVETSLDLQWAHATAPDSAQFSPHLPGNRDCLRVCCRVGVACRMSPGTRRLTEGPR